MNIAIIGHGHIGGGLGRAWAAKGHRITFGARQPDDQDLVALCRATGATAADLPTAVRDAEVVVLAVPYAAMDSVLEAVGDLAGKVVIDSTNALNYPGPSLKMGHTTSSAEELQKRIAKARVFRSFNAQGAENLVSPMYGDTRASNFFCGDDADGRVLVRQLVEDAGFDPVDAGPLTSARYIEPLMMLWVSCAKTAGTRDIAFRLLRR